MGAPTPSTMRVAAIVVVVAIASGAGGFALRTWSSRPPSRAGVDVGFLQDMVDHHEQAILLSSLVLDAEPAAPVRAIAVDIVAAQRYEIGVIDGWLRRWGYGRGAVQRTAMGWMGHPTPVAEMDGLATPADLARLTAASGEEAEAIFFDLMTRHHEAGVEMSEAAATGASDHDVRWLARLMARNQRREIREMESARLRLEAERGVAARASGGA
jgi:uncharacterized protein (DUF305 family)